MADKIELAKAYVQIVPSAQGIKGSISNVLNGEAESSGHKAGMSIASTIKNAIMAAGIGKALQSTIMEGANLQQSIGGVETMFKDSSAKLKEYASQAYATAGLSANKYMEQATSFSASLLQSLDGDTEKAVESANQAMIDMSDNANKFGTDISLIQNAYQGFAKSNFTMLDNLKLGYGGTKEEMQRLLVDASKLSGIKYDISNLSDIYEAIHVLQEEMDVTGTTAKESSTTIIGSYQAMASTMSNLLGAMSLGEDIKEPLHALLSTTKTFLFNNLIPMVGDILKSLPQIFIEIAPDMVTKGYELLNSLSQGFVQGFPNMLTSVLSMVQNFGTWLAEQTPTVIQKGFEMLNNLVDGIINGIPVMIERIPTIISTFANIINDNFPTILFKGAQLLLKFIGGIISAIPTLIANIPKIIKAIVDTIMAFQWLNLGKNIIDFFGNGIKSMFNFIKNKAISLNNNFVTIIQQLPSKLFNLGKNAISNFGNAIKSMFSWIGTQSKGLVTSVVSIVKTLPSKLLNIGKDMIKGLWNGISNMTGWIMNKIGGFASGIIDNVKSFFGIHSPSRVFRDEVGKNLSLGLAEGITENLKPVDDAIAKLNHETMSVLDTNVNVTSSNYSEFTDDREYKAILDLISIAIETKKNDSHTINRIYNILVDLLPQLANSQIVLDNGTLVGELTPQINEKLGILRKRESR